MDKMKKESVEKLRRRWFKIIRFTFLVGFVLVLAFLTYVHIVIFRDVKHVCAEARKEFPGDHVEALITYLKSDTHSFKEKNRAIWALGELADKRALTVLISLRTGRECDKPCSATNYICQYELEKAIKHCEGGFIPVKWIWRFL